MCIRRHLKETIPSSSITWSEMGKQNIQAKEVYCSLLSYDGYLTLDQIFVFDWPTDFAPQFFYKPNPPFNYVIGHKFIDSSMNRRSDRLSDRLTVSLSD